jgi:ribonucleoside-diphosphate reductase alpha chain
MTDFYHDAPVYNFAVEGADSYVVNGIAVHNCKGITVYREGSRQGVLMVDEKEKEEAKSPESGDEKWKRPQALIGKTVKLKIQQESLYVTSNFDETARIREVFINMGNTGSQEKSYVEAIGKLMSVYLQMNGGDVNVVIEKLKGIRATDSISWDRGLKLYSVPDAIAKALEITLGITSFKTTPFSERGRETGDGRQLGVAKHPDAKTEVKPAMCKECGENMLVYESGCYTCKNCGYTKCA